MINKILMFFFVVFFNISAYAFELVKIEASGDFERVDVWSGKFTDLSGKVWDTSKYYSQDNESYNTSFFINHDLNRFKFTTKIFLDSGYDSALIDVDPLYYISLSAKYQLSENEKIKAVIDPIIKMGGGVTESACYDDFRRAFHCGTGLAWSDAQSGGFLKKYEQDQSININYSINF